MDWYSKSMIEQGLQPDVHACGKSFIYRWKLEHRISFKSPNRRYKCSRKGLQLRLEIFWLNNIRVRHYALRILGVDPGRHCDGADQKGWFMNEQGSKRVGTLEIAGAGVVPLKENHADTRHRLTFMTYCSNNPERLQRGLPFEVCFKLTSGTRVLPALNLPPGPFSVRCSDSGSYREEHVYCYLELHLEDVTAERLAANDWRLFYLDIYAGHLSDRIFELCWSRIYFSVAY